LKGAFVESTSHPGELGLREVSRHYFQRYTYHAGTGAFNYADAVAVMRRHPSF
jgi:hypothetical protein